MARSLLDQFRRHAEFYGVEEVYEVAVADGFTAADLGRLALALRRIAPHWRLAREQRAELFVRLGEYELPDPTLRDYLGVSQKTLGRLRELPETSRTLEPQGGDPARKAENNGQKRDSGRGVQIPVLCREEAMR